VVLLGVPLLGKFGLVDQFAATFHVPLAALTQVAVMPCALCAKPVAAIAAASIARRAIRYPPRRSFIFDSSLPRYAVR
jgi:hypothetical protein